MDDEDSAAANYFDNHQIKEDDEDDDDMDVNMNDDNIGFNEEKKDGELLDGNLQSEYDDYENNTKETMPEDETAQPSTPPNTTTSNADDEMYEEYDNNDIDDDDDDDDDMDAVDLDAFLTSVESRVRSTFTSLELSRAITSTTTQMLHGITNNNSNNNSNTDGPSTMDRNLKYVAKVFERMAKPIKLRAIISLCGLDGTAGSDLQQQHQHQQRNRDTHRMKESERRRAYRRIWQLLGSAAEDDADDWVRVIAGIIRGKMFDPPSLPSAADSSSDPSIRGKTTDKLLRKATESVIKDICNAATEADTNYAQAEADLESSDDEEENNNKNNGTPHENAEKRLRRQKEKELLLQSYLIDSDTSPLFAPMRYALLPPEVVRFVTEEADSNPHFDLNNDSNILKLDDIIEVKRAEEERKEAEQKEKLRKQAELQQQKQAAAGARGGTATTAAAGRGRPGQRNAARARANGGPDTTSMFFRNRTNRPGMSSAVTGRGSRAAGLSMAGRGRGLARGRGFGRGAVAAAMGPSLAPPQRKNPVHNRQPGAAKALLGAKRSATSILGASGPGARRRRPGVRDDDNDEEEEDLEDSLTALSASTIGTRNKNNASSKMKMIDVAEVEGLTTNEHRQRDDKRSMHVPRDAKMLAKKRRIMEAAAARGLRRGAGSDAASDAILLASAPKRPKTNAGKRSPKRPPPTEQNDELPSSMLDGVLLAENHSDDDDDDDDDEPGGSALVAAALTAYQQQADDDTSNSFSNLLSGNDDGDNNATNIKDDWRKLLEKSNKLSMDDQLRVERFFTDRYNPTPEMTTYKMKLHEEKTTDLVTGQTVKETLYLELDYNTFGFKQSRKVKKK